MMSQKQLNPGRALGQRGADQSYLGEDHPGPGQPGEDGGVGGQGKLGGGWRTGNLGAVRAQGRAMGQLGVQGNGGQSGARAEVLHGPPGCPVFSDDVTQLQMQLGIDPFSTVSSQERLFPANTG